MGKGSNRESEWSSKTKVTYFKEEILGDKDILWLKVSMEDSLRVAVINAIYELVHKLFDLKLGEHTFLRVEILLEVILSILKDQVQSIVLHIVKDLFEPT
jgi:hypothetical protein